MVERVVTDISLSDDHSAYTAFVSRATADPGVVGLVLGGSRAHEAGMVTSHSDYDLWLITTDPPEEHWARSLTKPLDVSVGALAEFLAEAPEVVWLGYRYADANSVVLLDRLDGRITQAIRRRGSLSPDEAHKWTREMLDAYINSAYRAVKNHRDGLPFEAHVDTATAVHILCQVPFFLEGRIPPLPKYLAWELRHRPLADPAWQADRFVPRIQRLLAEADVDTHRAVFQTIERVGRAAGHGRVIDDWGDELEPLRTSPSG